VASTRMSNTPAPLRSGPGYLDSTCADPFRDPTGVMPEVLRRSLFGAACDRRAATLPGSADCLDDPDLKAHESMTPRNA
jgi:hypothetical protein